MFGTGKAVPVIIIMLMFHDVRYCSAQERLPTPSGVTFLGIGYNIIEGNPEGGDSSTGGADPGLLVSRSIFKMTYDQGKFTADEQYQVPDQVTYVLRDSAYTSASATTFHGTSSYAEKLSSQVNVEASYNNLFAGVQFASSSRYQQINARTQSDGYVYYANQTISNLGNARLLIELAGTDKYPLNNGFVTESCQLPATYSEDDYMTLLDKWGTHVVTEVDLGTREGSNYEEQRTDFVSFASDNVDNSVSSGGSYMGFSSSLSVDMGKFTAGMESGSSFGSFFSSFKIGSANLNEPISLHLIGMHEIFEEMYWTLMQKYVDEGHCPEGWDRAAAAVNVLTAMKGYAAWKDIQDSIDPDVKIPLTWPDGKYGLTKPIEGCPNAEFTWDEGQRYQDTEDNDAGNSFIGESPLPFVHFDGQYGASYFEQHFCIKTVSEVDDRSHWIWQPGSYCIYKYGDMCPPAFEEGYIYWDDEDHGNDNSVSGTLPAGEYGGNTKYYFCCRSDGVTDHAIFLPTDNNFYLFSRFGQCQTVDGMKSRREWFFWDVENHNPTSEMSSIHPYEGVAGWGSNISLMFCYYSQAA